MHAAAPTVYEMMREIVDGDVDQLDRIWASWPDLAIRPIEVGATRGAPDYFLDRIGHHVYAGDTAIHIAAASHRPEIIDTLLQLGADVNARNRRHAQPLHYAADSRPGIDYWRPEDQARAITALIEGGADPNAVDAGHATPLHRAVRTRGALAVSALLRGGADPSLQNRNGSTPAHLATRTTGRSGSGTSAAKAQQQQILYLFGITSASPAPGTTGARLSPDDRSHSR